MVTKPKKEKKVSVKKPKAKASAAKPKRAKTASKASSAGKTSTRIQAKPAAKAPRKTRAKITKPAPKKQKAPVAPVAPQGRVEEKIIKPAASVALRKKRPEPVVGEQPKVAVGPPPEKKKDLKELEINFPVTVKDLAVKLQEKPSNLIKMLMGMKVMAAINQRLDEPILLMLGEKLGFQIKKAPDEEEQALKLHQQEDAPKQLISRPPIVTFMGHVDHGKTSLLDAIRKSKVVDKEHGGITQHIGAYRVNLSGSEITFLDTPGHEAFTAMRARGASVTDMVVLVVAADDGIMPQTKEAIDHARAAGVSIIIAINKIDKPQADLDRVKKQLSSMDLLAEDWGGKTIIVGVSAKTGEGIDTLLEMILLEAQMLELKANPDRLAKGIVIEAKMSKGRGPVATLLVQNGTLRLNDNILIGKFYGKIRGMFNDHGVAVEVAPPSYPVEILGLSGIPAAGEQFFIFDDDRQAKEISAMRHEKEKQQQVKEIKHIGLEGLYSSIKEGKIKELKLIIKADVQGSLEAIKDTFTKLKDSEIKLTVIHEGVGNINSSDVILAAASDALVLGFNIKQDELAKELSAKEGVEVRIYNVIYELSREIKAALEGMLEPTIKKNFLGRAEIRKVFNLSRSGAVAGCFVTKGKIARSASVNLVRNGEVLYEGNILNLKRFKDDVREVAEGFECGITLKGFESLQQSDIIEAFEIEKIARKL